MVLNEIDALIGLLLHHHLPAKELRKQAIRMTRYADPRVTLLNDIIGSKNPHRTLAEILVVVDKTADIIEEVVKADYWGLVDVDGIGYPVELTFTAEDPTEVVNDLRWSQENENQVVTACAHAAMNMLERTTLSCGVTLFVAKGFSGRMTHRSVQVEIRHCPTAVKLRGGKQYF